MLLLVYKLIVIILSIFIVIGSFLFFRMSKKDPKKYWMYLSILAIWSVTWMVCARYIPILVWKINNVDIRPGAIKEYFLLSNLCPFVTFSLSISLMMNKRRFAQSISSWGIMSSSIVIVGYLLRSEVNKNLFYYFFIEFDGTFVMHFNLLILSLFTFVSIKKVTYKDAKVNWLYIFMYMLYLEIMRNIFEFRIEISGLAIYDWYPDLSGIKEDSIGQYFVKGNYGAVTSILNLNHPYNMIIGIIVFCAINAFILLTKTIKWNFKIFKTKPSLSY